ncbi:S-adenosyl-L-methionine-dependent methyltransferase [Marasmius fiardii PR-910]|nr:S-adenosyl-L-methionine-dependent methyltransferase [Marasmius fiardii PR-910]
MTGTVLFITYLLEMPPKSNRPRKPDILRISSGMCSMVHFRYRCACNYRNGAGQRSNVLTVTATPVSLKEHYSVDKRDNTRTMNTTPHTQIESLLQLIYSSTQQAVREYEKTGYGVPSPDDMEPHPLDTQAGATALRKAVRTLESACERLCTTLAQPMHTLANRAMPYEASCLRLVSERKIADLLNDAPKGRGMHINEIASRRMLAPDKLGQVMLLLATRGCFMEVLKDVYANNRISLTLLSSNPVSSTITLVAGEVLQGVTALPETLAHPEFAFSTTFDRTSFSYSVRERDPNRDTTISFFNWLKANPPSGERFQRAMTGASMIFGHEQVVQAYPWEDLITAESRNQPLKFCDVGSGPGAVALSLSKRFADPKSRFRFVLQDLSESLEQAKEVWRVEHPEADVDFVPLDFINESPVRGQDVYFLSLILHDWFDSDAITILRNVANAMNGKSRLLIHEMILQHAYRNPSDRQPASESIELVAPEPLLPNYGSGNVRAHNMNINMLATFNSRERTLEEFKDLGRRSGLKFVKILPLSETCLIEFRLQTGAVKL